MDDSDTPRQLPRGRQRLAGDPYANEYLIDIAGSIAKLRGASTAAYLGRLARGWRLQVSLRDQAEREREEAIRRALAGE